MPIVESDEDEFIVGRSLLEDLGISVERQLEQLAALQTDGDDPLELSETLQPARATDITGAVEAVMVLAIENGLPREKESQLREICFKYDIWRVELINDPPADVEPLAIRLRPNSRPNKYISSFRDSRVSQLYPPGSS
ncbi:TPA: hypothetical protein N0F65_005444 [Lagenidium giganteum]|uniref:Uncharacterized protein n=1 Tax=Lagenidium giganteum TaxID=4803 RepID=A0AAV2Z1D0_9STRA|nr:TPA: hypothetical protein N0F65_005444 [Lagenidium giganteum]